MKPREQANVIEFLRAFWPQTSSWPDATFDQWARALLPLSHTFMMEALHRMKDDPRWDFPPSWAHVFEEYNYVEGWYRKRQQEREIGDGSAPHDDPAQYPVVDHRTLRPSGVLTRLVQGRVQQEISRIAMPIRLHDHTSPDYIASCPVCSRHDHDAENRHVAECQRCENFEIVAYDLVRTRYYNNPRWLNEQGQTLADEWRAMETRGETIPVAFLPDRSIW